MCWHEKLQAVELAIGRRGDLAAILEHLTFRRPAQRQSVRILQRRPLVHVFVDIFPVSGSRAPMVYHLR